ncbi:hypothetical protein [Pectinatus frisingensis]|uniref:hypothetical protein n=1 Tax=Pectinatus frisingensis TaxID=865 RepID=UPI0018C46469|nr:hypothetical protein [Pectinatus frisingensis]
MTNDILTEILDESVLPDLYKNSLKNSLDRIEKSLPEDINIPKERWLAIGHHMSEVINRAIKKEQLPSIKSDTADQIESLYIEKSKKILDGFTDLKNINTASETLLLAIHLQCAANGY